MALLECESCGEPFSDRQVSARGQFSRRQMQDKAHRAPTCPNCGMTTFDDFYDPDEGQGGAVDSRIGRGSRLPKTYYPDGNRRGNTARRSPALQPVPLVPPVPIGGPFDSNSTGGGVLNQRERSKGAETYRHKVEERTQEAPYQQTQAPFNVSCPGCPTGILTAEALKAHIRAEHGGGSGGVE